MKKVIVCPNCEGKYTENEPCCPYCGTMYYLGAEKAYMEKLEDVRERYEDLANVPREVLKEELQCRKGFMIGLCTTIVVFLLLGVTIYQMVVDRKNAEEIKAEFWWKYENYPLMEELYQSGEHDKVLEYINEGLVSGYAMYEWEYSYYYNIYEALKETRDIQALEMQGTALEKDELTDLFYYQVQAVFALEDDDYTKSQRAEITPLIEEIREDFYSRWPMTQAEHDEIYQKLAENYFVWLEWEECEDYINNWYGGR